MSNIKPTYWMPCLGVAFIVQDQASRLNPREERLLVIYHCGMLAGLVILGALLLG